MEKVLQIGCVNYLNTLPLIMGLEQIHDGTFNVHQLRPKDCYKAFQKGDVDISLVPSGALHLLSDYSIVGNSCIGSSGAVYSVALFANTSLENLHTIYLDNHSTTSVALLKILVKRFWKLDVQYIDAHVQDITLQDGEGMLMIGDKAFDGHNQYTHIYDLGSAWREYTQKPFVYACWIAKPHIEKHIIDKLDQALMYGVQNIPRVIHRAKALFPDVDVDQYFNSYIDYHFDSNKKEALHLFCKWQEELYRSDNQAINSYIS